MGHCIRLMLPDRDEGAQGEILDRIVSRWDGVTVTRGFGLWNEPKCRVREPFLILECSIPVWDENSEVWWDETSREACILFGETCIFLSVRSENAMLVYPDYTESI